MIQSLWIGGVRLLTLVEWLLKTSRFLLCTVIIDRRTCKISNRPRWLTSCADSNSSHWAASRSPSQPNQLFIRACATSPRADMDIATLEMTLSFFEESKMETDTCALLWRKYNYRKLYIFMFNGQTLPGRRYLRYHLLINKKSCIKHSHDDKCSRTRICSTSVYALESNVKPASVLSRLHAARGRFRRELPVDFDRTGHRWAPVDVRDDCSTW